MLLGIGLKVKAQIGPRFADIWYSDESGNQVAGISVSTEIFLRLNDASGLIFGRIWWKLALTLNGFFLGKIFSK